MEPILRIISWMLSAALLIVTVATIGLIALPFIVLGWIVALIFL